jgi:hypothetical protein
MKEIDWSLFKVRCSAISKVCSSSRDYPCLTELQEQELKDLEAKPTLTDKQKEKMAALIVKRENGKKVILSDTCIEYLMEEYAWRTEGMISVGKESMELLQLKKGKMQEGEAVKLLCIVDGIMYNINKERVYNDFLSGELDIFDGQEVMGANSIGDIKNSFDYPVFLKKINKGLENGNKEQVQGYCDIAKSSKGFIAHCLVDMPEEIIEDMKYRLLKKMNCATELSPEFMEEWEKWERSMRFSHIPPAQRVFKIPVTPFTEFERQKVYDRVKICREWLNSFHETFVKLNL